MGLILLDKLFFNMVSSIFIINIKGFFYLYQRNMKKLEISQEENV